MWISGNFYLTQAQMENNADEVIFYFRSEGWTDEAIAAMLGNMQHESNINPGIWENLTVGTGGYGLVQWTPYTKYSDWVQQQSPGTEWRDNGDWQMYRIRYELQNGLQWLSTDQYPMTFAEFTQSHAAPELLAQVWLYNYERPQVKPQPVRSTSARRWFNYMGGTPGPTELPIWLLFKFKQRR